MDVSVGVSFNHNTLIQKPYNLPNNRLNVNLFIKLFLKESLFSKCFLWYKEKWLAWVSYLCSLKY